MPETGLDLVLVSVKDSAIYSVLKSRSTSLHRGVFERDIYEDVARNYDIYFIAPEFFHFEITSDLYLLCVST